MQGLLERLGLHRPELRAWALYDWANSVFMTTVIQVASPATALYGGELGSVGVSGAIAAAEEDDDRAAGAAVYGAT